MASQYFKTRNYKTPNGIGEIQKMNRHYLKGINVTSILKAYISGLILSFILYVVVGHPLFIYLSPFIGNKEFIFIAVLWIMELIVTIVQVYIIYHSVEKNRIIINITCLFLMSVITIIIGCFTNKKETISVLKIIESVFMDSVIYAVVGWFFLQKAKRLEDKGKSEETMSSHLL